MLEYDEEVDGDEAAWEEEDSSLLDALHAMEDEATGD